METMAFVQPLKLGHGSIAALQPACDVRRGRRYVRAYTVCGARMDADAGNMEKATATSITNDAEIASRKAELYSAVADLDLGRKVLDDETAQKELDKLIVRLEELNPTPDPADHPLRRARWRVVYTNSPIVLGRSRPGFSRPEKCWQTIDMVDGADEGCVQNEEEGVFNLFGMEFRWRNQIVGVCRALKGERIRLKFERFTLGKFISVPFPGPVVGWQDQTFLDDSCRVARTHFGNVFVLEREPEWE